MPPRCSASRGARSEGLAAERQVRGRRLNRRPHALPGADRRLNLLLDGQKRPQHALSGLLERHPPEARSPSRSRARSSSCPSSLRRSTSKRRSLPPPSGPPIIAQVRSTTAPMADARTRTGGTTVAHPMLLCVCRQLHRCTPNVPTKLVPARVRALVMALWATGGAAGGIFLTPLVEASTSK